VTEFKIPSRRRIFLMRHGDVTYFDDSGRAIDPETVPLNAHGLAQARAAGEAFAVDGVRFDRVGERMAIVGHHFGRAL